MSISGRTDGPDEATQHDFLDAQRRWNADEKGDFKLPENYSDYFTSGRRVVETSLANIKDLSAR